MPKIEGFSHVSLSVTDQVRSARWYEEVFGFVTIEQLDEPISPSRELDQWKERLTELGLTHSEVVDRHYGAGLCLRDPDRIQLELFWREDHP